MRHGGEKDSDLQILSPHTGNALGPSKGWHLFFRLVKIKEKPLRVLSKEQVGVGCGKGRQSGDIASAEIIGTAPRGGDKREGEPMMFREAMLSLHLPRKISQSHSLCRQLRGMGSQCPWIHYLPYICGDKP